MSKLARKKSDKQLIIDGLNNKYIVEKSRALVLMKEVPFSLGELKVLDTYLSRINARDPDATTVRFTKEEYEDLMGIERMHTTRLEKYVTSLMSQTVTIPDKNAKGGWKAYTLFDEAECFQDDNGQWNINLSCTAKAKKLFFNLENIGYIRYQLKNILPLTSKYSVLLYIYLLDNRFRKVWEVSIDELRTNVFRCTDTLYDEYKYLHQRILKKCLDEVNEKTDISFTYKPIRTGRRVTDIQFTLIQDNVTIDTTAEPVLPLPDNSEEADELLASAVDNSFNKAEMDVIFNIIVNKPLSDAGHGIDIARYHYLRQKYTELLHQEDVKLRRGEPSIKDRFRYFCKMLEADDKLSCN